MTNHAMNNIISLNQSLSIDLPTLLDTRLLVQANSGGGKSWLLRRILEQSHGHVQQIVIDLEGEFATLREKYDYVLAGKDGDTPADPRSAGLLAQRLLELNVSAIIDLYELHYQDRKHFFRLFLESMINAPKQLWHPCLVVIDEAHKFCPEKEQSEASSAVIDLATLGRKRGYCAILATQRLSKLHKDAAAECNNKLIGRTTLDVDMKRASEELGFSTKEQALSLRNLDAGEFFAFGPAISPTITRVKIGEVQTSHPKAGSRILATPIPPTAKIRAVLESLKDLPQEAEEEAKTVGALQQQITHLKRQLAQKPQGAEISVPSKEIDTAIKTALQRQQRLFDQEKQQLESRTTRLQQVLRDIVVTITNVLEEPVPNALLENHTPLPPVTPKQPSPTPKRIDGELTAGAARILAVLAARQPMVFTKAQLATLARLSARGGAYIRYLSLLKSKGFITIDGHQIRLTHQGLQEAGKTPEQPKTSEKVIEMWQNNLSGGARRIFDVLTELYPQPVTREEISHKTGLTSRGGAFGRYLSMLRNNGLIVVEGSRIKASETLFL